MTQFANRTFSVPRAGRSPAICEANGRHGEPDRRGRCFLCGEQLPASAAAQEFDARTAEPIEPDSPLATVAGVEVCQRVTGALYTRRPDGREQDYPVGFAVSDVVADLTRAHAHFEE